MGVTRLKRKDRKNKARANNKVAKIKQLLSTPVIKNVDVDELKAQFTPSDKQEQAPAAPKAEAPVKEEAANTAKAAPKAEAPAEAEASDAAEAPSEVEENTEKETVTTVEAEAPGIDEGPKVDGDLETPAQTFVENQLADTTSGSSEKDIEAAKKLEDDENRNEEDVKV